MDAAFNKSKQVLANAVPLAHPTPDAAIAVPTDASDTHIGGVLNQQQQVRGSWQPLGASFSVGYHTFCRQHLRGGKESRPQQHTWNSEFFVLSRSKYLDPNTLVIDMDPELVPVP